jgi:hypothetical protein
MMKTASAALSRLVEAVYGLRASFSVLDVKCQFSESGVGRFRCFSDFPEPDSDIDTDLDLGRCDE